MGTENENLYFNTETENDNLNNLDYYEMDKTSSHYNTETGKPSREHFNKINNPESESENEYEYHNERLNTEVGNCTDDYNPFKKPKKSSNFYENIFKGKEFKKLKPIIIKSIMYHEEILKNEDRKSSKEYEKMDLINLISKNEQALKCKFEFNKKLI